MYARRRFRTLADIRTALLDVQRGGAGGSGPLMNWTDGGRDRRRGDDGSAWRRDVAGAVIGRSAAGGQRGLGQGLLFGSPACGWPRRAKPTATPLPVHALLLHATRLPPSPPPSPPFFISQRTHTHRLASASPLDVTLDADAPHSRTQTPPAPPPAQPVGHSRPDAAVAVRQQLATGRRPRHGALTESAPRTFASCPAQQRPLACP
jgi:hypothetical protein